MLWIKFKPWQPWHTKIVCMAGWFSQISEYNVVGFDSSPCKEHQVTMRQTRMTWVILSIKGQYFSWIPCRKSHDPNVIPMTLWTLCFANAIVTIHWIYPNVWFHVRMSPKLVDQWDGDIPSSTPQHLDPNFEKKCPIHKVFRNPQMHDLCPWIETFSVQDS